MLWLKLICALPPALAAMFLGACGCDGGRCRFKAPMALPRLQHGCCLAQVEPESGGGSCITTGETNAIEGAARSAVDHCGLGELMQHSSDASHACTPVYKQTIFGALQDKFGCGPRRLSPGEDGAREVPHELAASSVATTAAENIHGRARSAELECHSGHQHSNLAEGLKLELVPITDVVGAHALPNNTQQWMFPHNRMSTSGDDESNPVERVDTFDVHRRARW